MEPYKIHAQTGEGRYKVTVLAELTAQSALVRIYDGTRPHIGAVAVHGSDGEQTAASFPGHREMELTRELAGRFVAETGWNVVVIMGVHVDNASREEVAQLTHNIREASDALLQQMTDASYYDRTENG